MAEPAAATGTFSFVRMEHEVLELWERSKVFERSMDQRKGKKPYIFYDGPPFATGLPHHGHIVASTIKDIVPRYWTMKGRHVLRRFGWDCHGLPIEHEIDKQLGMSAQQAVAELGVAGYNDECRAIVGRYVAQWRQTITRLGRWVDFDNDYKTMDAWYMESLWWVVKALWDRGLIYQGHKIMPVSTALETPLSNFEASANYMEVQDPAITVLLKLSDEDAYLSVWTTTPWTLPSNLAVCVNAGLRYVKAQDPASGRHIYFAEERLAAYGDLEIKSRLRGSDLVGRSYEPPFPYFAEERARGAFRVVADDYVTADEGTGLVHQAPAFGEDDARVLKTAGIEAFVCPVSMQGRFTDEVSDFAGQYVKDADRAIIEHLKEARRSLPPGNGAARLSLLLPLGHPPDLPGGAKLVRAGHRHRGQTARRQRRGALGAGAHQGRPLRQLAQGRGGLGHFPQPGVGDAHSHLDQRCVRQGGLHRLAGRVGGPHRSAA